MEEGVVNHAIPVGHTIIPIRSAATGHDIPAPYLKSSETQSPV